MAYELVRYQKLRTDLINKTELPSQLVYSSGYAGDPLAAAYDAATTAGSTADAKAKAWLSKVGVSGTTVDRFKDAAFKYGYAYGESLLAKCQGDATCGKIANVGGMSLGAGLDAAAFAVKAKDGKMWSGPEGVATTIDFVRSMNKFVVSFAQQFDPEVAQTIDSVFSVATACAGAAVMGLAAAPASMGITAVIGALTCAGTFFGTLFNSFKAPQFAQRRAETPPFIFTPQKAHQKYLPADAYRLGAVLAAHYNQNSYRGIVDRLAQTWPVWWSGGQYASGSRPPMKSDGGFDFTDWTQKTIPAVDPWGMLVALDFEMGADGFYNLHEGGDGVWVARTPFANTRLGLYLTLLHTTRFLAAHPTDYPLNPAGLGNDLANRFFNWSDIPQTAIQYAATLGRTAIAKTGKPIVYATFGYGSTWKTWLPGDDEDAHHIWAINLAPFIRYDELINYFAAVTQRELDATTDVVDTYIGSELPVRNWGVVDRQSGTGYGNTCWTTLYREGDESISCNKCGFEGDSLCARTRRGEPSAVREFAWIRLHAAMSQLMLQFQWSNTISDAVAINAAAMATPDPILRTLRAPVDPRQAFPNGDGTWELLFPEARTTAPASPGLDNNFWFRNAPGEQRIFDIPATFSWHGKPHPFGLGAIAIIDGKFLAADIRRRADEVDDAMTAGKNAAFDDGIAREGVTWPAEDTSFVMARPDAMVALTTANQSHSLIDPAMKAAMMRGEFANVGDMSGQYAQQCVREGGVVTWNAAGEIQCNPSAAAKPAMEAKCRASGGVPTWMQGRKGQQMRCLPPMHPDAPKQLAVAGSSNSIVPIVGIAAVALLAFRFLK